MKGEEARMKVKGVRIKDEGRRRKGRKNSYRNLIVWQKSMKLVKEIYKITMVFPDEEKFGLTSQIKRAAVSVPSNIAEGKGRGTNKDFIYFLYIALGSLYELQTQLELANELGFVKSIDAIDTLSVEIEKMINALINSKKDNNE
ncbi:four helix bundle protein [Nautilia sp. PV-1]|uniref:four helix bundle protein n=1 Tax=Nautilia sp. PV-1 TaxID=2579250 RepID=UPI001FEE37A2|nr:four helix bundle protein [Nautilia sp. PV-1]